MHAHGEIEERVLLALRKLEYWQSLVIAEMVEALGRGKIGTFGKPLVPVRELESAGTLAAGTIVR